MFNFILFLIFIIKNKAKKLSLLFNFKYRVKINGTNGSVGFLMVSLTLEYYLS
jgi:hypothetical protein